MGPASTDVSVKPPGPCSAGVETVEAVAEEVGASPAHVSLAWLMHHPDVTAPIVGARTVDQLEEDLAAADVELTDEQFDRLAEAGGHGD